MHPSTGFVAHDPHRQGFRSTKVLRDAVTRHVNNDMERSPFISTSLSLFWAIATAYNFSRVRETTGKQINISIIRARDLNPDMLYVALEHLPMKPSDPHVQKLRSWADQSQEVLVLGRIPAAAVIRTVTLDFAARTVATGKELCNVKNLPWLTLPIDDWKGASKDYAEKWFDAFIHYPSQKKHAMESLRWAASLLGKDINEPLSQDLLALAIYLPLAIQSLPHNI